uniref:Uncharacterized protein n=1 Tax=Oryza rufipogon TaxID=4529 RepID=A0A0E0PAD0_ORYRU
MALAAQLYGSAAAAAYRRLPLYGVPSSCRWPRTPLAALPKLSISTGGMGMNPFGVGAKVSIKCTNGTTQVDELNFRSNQTEELVEGDADTVTQKRSAKIHDFCLGIPFGVAPGLTTLFLGTLSLKFWRSGKSSFIFILGQAAISAVLAWKYSHAYILTNRILPWAFYASLSTAMACFYAYVLLSGGNPPPKKKMAATPSS